MLFRAEPVGSLARRHVRADYQPLTGTRLLDERAHRPRQGESDIRGRPQTDPNEIVSTAQATREKQTASMSGGWRRCDRRGTAG
jgi:hypothetical protein